MRCLAACGGNGSPHLVGQDREDSADVGLQPHRHGVVPVDLGREPVDVDDLLVAARVDADGIELLELVAHGHQHVRLIEAEIDVVVAHEPHGAQGLGVVVGQHALAVERRHDGERQPLGEPLQRRPGPGPGRPVAGQHDGAPRPPQHGDRPGHLVGRGLVRARDADREGPGVDRGRRLLDVLGNGQVHGAGSLGSGQLECLADHLGDGGRGGDQRRPLGDRGEHRDQVHPLVGLLEAPGHAHLGRQGHERGRVGGGVGGTQQQVDGPRARAWPSTPRDDR